MKTIMIAMSVAAVFAGTSLSNAQSQENRPPPGPRERGEGGHEGGRDGGREGGSMRMNPLFSALDSNNDGVIDEKEIANAPAALKKLDKNGDGKITMDEVRPTMGERGPGQGGVNPDEMVNRLMQYDKNGDGKLSKDELPERMQGMFDRGDTDKDGFLTKDEIRKMAAQTAPATGNRGGREGQGPRPNN